ncbi:MAG: phosphodiester glycosidase family protein [Clostridia bacterium]|nr:phosphodiester glycosidase family protein [Clostridia bacterium]
MKKGLLFGILYGVILAAFTVYVALDAFVIPRVYAPAEAPTATPAAEARATETPADTAQEANVYDDGETRIVLTEYRLENTTVYVADVTLSDPSALAAVLAENAYGRNVTETTSAMAERSGAILAVNGDYYGSRQRGYVVRNGVLYRDVGTREQEDLVIDENGDFSIILENEVSAQALVASGARQVFSFGPALVIDGEVSVSVRDEVGRARASNPRTAIAQVGELHYLFVVADGRTDSDEGLTLYELAVFLQQLGARTAYNLDGGGSSVMVFKGEVVNNPAASSRDTGEREVSDIVGIF